MRLWHYDLIKKLPRQQLLGQHRECCALRGMGWGKPHSVINYIFDYPYYTLYEYHVLIMDEMKSRGYVPNCIWYDNTYRGSKIGYDSSSFTMKNMGYIYKEHNHDYYMECAQNLMLKGIYI